MTNFIAWTDLRGQCSMCKNRADFRVEYDNKRLPKKFLRSGTRVTEYCLDHLPEEIKTDRQLLIVEAQKPFERLSND